MMEPTKFQAIPNHSPATAKLVEYLGTMKPGNFVSDAELKTVCGKAVGVGDPGYSNLQTAIRRTCEIHGLDFQRVRGAAGIKCYSAHETATTLDYHQKRIRREAHRGLRRAGTVRIEDIPDEDRSRYLALCAQLGVLHGMAKSEATKALEARRAQSAPDMSRILEAFEQK